MSDEGSAYTTDEGDPDGDGFGNRTEYDEGTVPVDYLSFPFRILDFSPTNLVWLGGKNASYTIEMSSSLDTSAEWSDLVGADPNNGTVTNSAAIPSDGYSASRFFRIRAR